MPPVSLGTEGQEQGDNELDSRVLFPLLIPFAPVLPGIHLDADTDVWSLCSCFAWRQANSRLSYGAHSCSCLSRLTVDPLSSCQGSSFSCSNSLTYLCLLLFCLPLLALHLTHIPLCAFSFSRPLELYLFGDTSTS